jgi:hypothetical protein
MGECHPMICVQDGKNHHKLPFLQRPDNQKLSNHHKMNENILSLSARE